MKCKECEDYRYIETEYGAVRKCAEDGHLLSEQDEEKEKVCADYERLW